MINELVCRFKGHKLEHIANFSKGIEMRNNRGLWQCSCCKKMVMEMPTDFYSNRDRKTPTI